MSVSTDAILAYGYDLGEAHEYEDDTGIEDSNYYDQGESMERRLLGSLVGFTDSWTKGDETFFKRKKEAQEKMGLEIIYHCSGDYPMYFLAIKGTEIRAYRGSPVKINYLDINETHEHWDAKLQEGLKVLNIETKNEFGYHLFSMWD